MGFNCSDSNHFFGLVRPAAKNILHYTYSTPYNASREGEINGLTFYVKHYWIIIFNC